MIRRCCVFFASSCSHPPLGLSTWLSSFLLTILVPLYYPAHTIIVGVCAWAYAFMCLIFCKHEFQTAKTCTCCWVRGMAAISTALSPPPPQPQQLQPRRTSCFEELGKERKIRRPLCLRQWSGKPRAGWAIVTITRVALGGHQIARLCWHCQPLQHPALGGREEERGHPNTPEVLALHSLPR